MDDFGERMKMYEERGGVTAKSLPLLPIMVRLDGKAFHSFTRGLERPFCIPLIKLMDATCEYLVDSVDGCRIGYVQSDEISLVLYSDNTKTQVMFDGRVQKLVSVLASMATAKFNSLLPFFLPERKGLAHFDCRVWQVPTLEEAANALLWRERDAAKNSVAMLAQSEFSHAELQGKSMREMQAMLLAQRNRNWDHLDPRLKRGAFFQRRRHECPMDPALAEWLEAIGQPIPATITKSKVERIDMPSFGTVVNRVGVIFNYENPVVGDDLNSGTDA